MKKAIAFFLFACIASLNDAGPSALSERTLTLSEPTDERDREDMLSQRPGLPSHTLKYCENKTTFSEDSNHLCQTDREKETTKPKRKRKSQSKKKSKSEDEDAEERSDGNE